MNAYNIISREIGSFTLDVTTVEMHDSTLTLTENPIESGANTADHAILNPRTITIVGTMVGYEPSKAFEQVASSMGYEVSDLPLPFELQGVTSQAISLVNRYASTFTYAVEESKRILAPWLPDYLTFTNDESDTLDRVGKARNQLLELQRSGEVIDIVTGVAKYSNMMITSVGVFQQFDGSAEFTITAREVFIVESKVAGGLSVKTSRAGQQSSTTKDMGKTQPTQDKSALSRIKDLVL